MANAGLDFGVNLEVSVRERFGATIAVAHSVLCNS